MPMRVVKGVYGDVTGTRHDELAAYYRFEDDFPDYEWDIGIQMGDELAAWFEDFAARIEAYLRKDAARLDVTLGMLRDQVSWELIGPGARELNDDDGKPAWDRTEHAHQWAPSEKTWDRAIDDARGYVRAFGNNELGIIYRESGIPIPKGTTKTKPLYMQLKVAVVRINSADLREIGRRALEYFMGQESKRRKKTIEKRLETIAEKKRKEAAKRGWETRKRRERYEKMLETRTVEALELLMYEQLLKLAETYEKGKKRRALRNQPQRSKSKGKKGSRIRNRKTKRNTR